MEKGCVNAARPFLVVRLAWVIILGYKMSSVFQFLL